MAHTVLVLSDPAAKHLALLERLPAGTRIVKGDTPEAFVQAAPEADVMLVGLVPRALIEAVWPLAPRLKWVHTLAAGLDTLLFQELVDSPVPLTNSRGVYSASLAEFAISGMLWFAKDLDRMRRQREEAAWSKFEPDMLHGRQLGLLGHGSIARATAVLAEAFGMEILALGRRHTREQLEELLSTSDYLLVSTPLTAETRGLVGDAELRLMKPSAVVINLGRGPVVVEEALVSALRERRIRGAVLDVYDVEPLPQGHPFWSLDNVLLSPHCADNVPGWLNDSVEFFLSNFERFDNGEPLENIVGKERGY